jgi:hypothetical protein
VNLDGSYATEGAARSPRSPMGMAALPSEQVHHL